MPDQATKYERFLTALQAAVVVADVQTGGSVAAHGIDYILANSETGLPSIIDHQADSAEKMVNDYVAFLCKGGGKPPWLAQAGL